MVSDKGLIERRENIFGVQDWCNAGEWVANLIRDLKVKFVRNGNWLNWYYREPNSKGSYAWDDSLYNLLKSRNVVCYGMIEHYCPNWATSIEPYNYKNPPDNPQDFGDFAGACYDRYPFIRLWEIGNEPEWAFNGTEQQWVDMTHAAYDALKAKNSQNVIIGAYGWGGIHNIYTEHCFLDPLRQNGFLNYVDALAIHPYSACSDPPFVQQPRLNTLRNYLATYGKQNIPLFATEWGFCWGSANVCCLNKDEAWCNTQMLRQLDWFAQTPQIKMVVYFLLRDTGGGESGLGLTYWSDGPVKRTRFYTYANYIKAYEKKRFKQKKLLMM